MVPDESSRFDDQYLFHYLSVTYALAICDRTGAHSPRFLRSAVAVPIRSRKSRAKQMDLAYSISRSVRSSIGPLPRARTCRSPVSPGLTSCRSCCHGWYLATTDGSSGRGPTRLICPLTTLNSCGSSSRLHRRRKRPTVVCLGSSPDLWVHRRSGHDIGTFA